MTIQIYSILIVDGRRLKRLAANAIIFELERRMDGATYHRIDARREHALVLRILLDRIGGDPTEPIVRSRVLVAVGEPEPLVVEHFDVRLRDWLALPQPDLSPDQLCDQVGPERRVDIDHLMPDEHSPGGPHWLE